MDIHAIAPELSSSRTMLKNHKGRTGVRGEFNPTPVSRREQDGLLPRYRAELAAGNGNAEQGFALPSFAYRHFPSFSPKGDRIVFTNGQAGLSHNGLVEASADGTNRWLIHDDLQRNTTAPSWSPTGDWIAFGPGGAFQGFVGTGRVTSTIALIRTRDCNARASSTTRGTLGLR
jgi:hypothetical protein